MQHDTELLEAPETHTVTEKQRALVLHNDDYNTFEFVIQSLIVVCDHDPVQAEQCTYLVHYKGKCDVKSGTYKDLKPYYNELLNRGLTATIN
jgi:ATP-dependent Clp protease adaptor protein ClpS